MRLTTRTNLALRTLMVCAVNPDRIIRKSDVAEAINASGVIVGHGLHAPWGRRAFMLVPDTGCPADLNGDGILDLADISAFIIAFTGHDPVADLTGDGILDLDDISAFIVSFTSGCP